MENQPSVFSLALERFDRLPAYDRMEPHQLPDDAFDLTRFQCFLDAIGNPEKGLPVIHVAGSKGKGSTSALIGSGLQALNKRVGVFMSPYLYKPNESIFVDGQPMSNDRFSVLMQRYEPLLKRYRVTAFELLTAMALQYFNEEDVDFVVLEAGLGGRQDATNVVESPVLSVICPIEKEHSEILGHSITSIAYEKLGIVREQTPVILGFQSDPYVADFSKTVAQQKHSALISASVHYEPFILKRSCLEGYHFRLKSPTRTIPRIELSLLGDHQIKNAITAWAALDQLIPDFPIEPVLNVWRHLTLPGRFEYRVIQGREWIFDGAHTPESAKALRKTLEQLYERQTLTFLLAFLSDKSVEDFLVELLRYGDAIVFTQVDHPRCLPARVVEERVRPFLNSYGITSVLTNNVQIAKQKALKMNSNNPICVTGSFKLLEAIY